jgi:hypothetical protein
VADALQRYQIASALLVLIAAEILVGVVNEAKSDDNKQKRKQLEEGCCPHTPHDQRKDASKCNQADHPLVPARKPTVRRVARRLSLYDGVVWRRVLLRLMIRTARRILLVKLVPASAAGIDGLPGIWIKHCHAAAPHLDDRSRTDP